MSQNKDVLRHTKIYNLTVSSRRLQCVLASSSSTLVHGVGMTFWLFFFFFRHLDFNFWFRIVITWLSKLALPWLSKDFTKLSNFFSHRSAYQHKRRPLSDCKFSSVVNLGGLVHLARFLRHLKFFLLKCYKCLWWCLSTECIFKCWRKGRPFKTYTHLFVRCTVTYKNAY